VVNSILIVHNNMSFRSNIRTTLREASFKGEIYNLNDATKLPEFLKNEPVDLVILDNDIPMSILTGLDIVDDLKEKGNNYTKFIILSSDTNHTTVQKAKKLQVSGFLVKPFSVSSIVKIVNKL